MYRYQAEGAARSTVPDQGYARLLSGLHVCLQGWGQDVGAL
jgi:hypothetical protein